jgi:hypothetical protein
MDKESRLKSTRQAVKIVIGVLVGLTVLMLPAYRIEDGSFLPEGNDAIPFLFSPIGYTLGLIVAFKWEGLGGLINVACVIGWQIALHVVESDSGTGFVFYLTAIPGLVFIALWYAERKLRRERAARNESLSPDQLKSGA